MKHPITRDEIEEMVGAVKEQLVSKTEFTEFKKATDKKIDELMTKEKSE